uniref:FBA_2 domain-containing protein n=2 Tax=Caenorhabditis tropicalis TaxID=1561998 RepID=A0A1I7UU26_9PELO
MTTFPLLQLPLVAMEHVLCMMSPFELIHVSLASSRAKTIVRNFSKTKDSFSVSFSNYWLSISFHRNLMIWTYSIHINQDHANMYAIIHQNDRIREMIRKVSEEPLKDIMKWYDYAREVLNCKINSLTFRFYLSSSENRRTIDWIAAQSNTMEWMELSSVYEESDDDLKYLMERILVSGHFKLKVKKYKNDFRMEIPGNPEWLHIENAQFLNYDQLLRLKSPIIILRESILTNEEIHRFLRSWMSCETHLELEALEISISGPDAINEIMDLPHEKTNDPRVVQAFDDYHMISQVENEIFTIERGDGQKRASVTVARLWDEWRLCLIVHSV